MKIGLLGYGKMGKTIEKFAKERGHEITLIIDIEEDWEQLNRQEVQVDVAIDFSTPSAVIKNIAHCFERKIPIVVGTTAWYNEFDRLQNLCHSHDSSLIWSSNFSIGVNIFFKINQQLAKLMNAYPDYEVTIEEIHHTAKLDAPSGTAISLAKDILKELDRKNNWTLSNNPKTNDLSITAKRIDPVTGTHSIVYENSIDRIMIQHEAKNRNGFALGALIAAEWIQNRRGWFEFQEVFF
jgi:4-hydroxy-tetrahydrodipicolinate reductase